MAALSSFKVNRGDSGASVMVTSVCFGRVSDVSSVRGGAFVGPFLSLRAILQKKKSPVNFKVECEIKWVGMKLAGGSHRKTP